MRDGTFDVSKHGHRLPGHALAAYRSAISRGVGRDVARAEALAAFKAGEDLIGELHRRAFATSAQLMAIQYGGKTVPGSPERVALWDELSAARTTYRKAVSPGTTGQVPIAPPNNPAEATEWEEALWDRINALPDSG